MLKATIIGHLGKDAEVKYSQDNKPRIEYSVGCDTGFGDRKGTEWVRCVIFGKRADSGLADYMHKGLKVYSDGDLTTNEWQGQDGKTFFSLNLNVDDFHFCNQKQDGGDTNRRGNNSYANEQVSPDLITAKEPDDDIPF